MTHLPKRRMNDSNVNWVTCHKDIAHHQLTDRNGGLRSRRPMCIYVEQ